MSSSRAIKPRRDDTILSGWEHAPDTAPSITREEVPTVARVVAMIGTFLILLGLIPVVAPLMKMTNPVIGLWTSFFSISTGVVLILFHAFMDRDLVFRRMYAGMGLIAVAGAIILRMVPLGGSVGGWFPLVGFPALILGLVLLVAAVRNETERAWRSFLLNVLGMLGGAMLLAGVGVGVFSRLPNFLPGEGILYLILGLCYAGAFIGHHEDEKLTFYAGLALGGIGLVAVAGAIIRSLLPESTFFIPSGLILMVAGIIYLAVCAGICLDWPIIVLTRRELASTFYSPIAYLIMLGMLLVGWYMFWQFIETIVVTSLGLDPRPMFEPIVAQFVFELFLVIVQMFIVPAITMRVLAEEHRTGTLEMLLTAPVSEATVVISKFLGAWFFYMLTWLPTWLFLIALRYMGGQEFDYRPLLSFNIAMLAVGAGFISMGVFFSSLTRNQIIAAVLCFVGMIGHLAAYIMKYRARMNPGDFWYEVLTYVSFLDLWMNTLEGTFAPRFLLFHVSATVFFLYATVKVLEARKWK